MLRLVTVVALLGCACGGSTPEADEPDDRTSSLGGGGCPMLLGCHDDVAAGCPEPFFEFVSDSDDLQPRTVAALELLAAEIRDTPQLRSLRIQGLASSQEKDDIAGQRAARIRDWLVEAGVADQMLDVGGEQTRRDDSTYATLEVVDCSGATDQAESKAGSYSIILF